jgi:hypothetical protein
MRACMHATQMFCKHVANSTHQEPVVKQHEQHQRLTGCASYQFPCCLTACNFEDATEPSTGMVADFIRPCPPGSLYNCDLVWGDDGTPDALINVRPRCTSALSDPRLFFCLVHLLAHINLGPSFVFPIYFVPPVEQTNTELKRFHDINTLSTPHSLTSIATNYNNVCTTFALWSSYLPTSKPSNALTNRYIVFSEPITNTDLPVSIFRQVLSTNTSRAKTSQPGLTYLHQRDHPAQPVLDIKSQKARPLRGPCTTKAQRLCTSLLLLWSRRAGATPYRKRH